MNRESLSLRKAQIAKKRRRRISEQEQEQRIQSSYYIGGVGGSVPKFWTSQAAYDYAMSRIREAQYNDALLREVLRDGYHPNHRTALYYKAQARQVRSHAKKAFRQYYLLKQEGR